MLNKRNDLFVQNKTNDRVYAFKIKSTTISIRSMSNRLYHLFVQSKNDILYSVNVKPITLNTSIYSFNVKPRTKKVTDILCFIHKYSTKV